MLKIKYRLNKDKWLKKKRHSQLRMLRYSKKLEMTGASSTER